MPARILKAELAAGDYAPCRCQNQDCTDRSESFTGKRTISPCGAAFLDLLQEAPAGEVVSVH